MSSASAIDRLVRNHYRRHSHVEDPDHCPYCGGFISLDATNGIAKTICGKCGKPVLRYVR